MSQKPPTVTVTRSGRKIKAPEMYEPEAEEMVDDFAPEEYNSDMSSSVSSDIEYSSDELEEDDDDEEVDSFVVRTSDEEEEDEDYTPEESDEEEEEEDDDEGSADEAETEYEE
jgi:hypothetical protein